MARRRAESGCWPRWSSCDLSDPAAEEALYDSITKRRFASASTDADVILDETSMVNFRRLLERRQSTERLFAEINAPLSERGLFVGKGTIVDATIINAPSSTKNEKKNLAQMNILFGLANLYRVRYQLLIP